MEVAKNSSEDLYFSWSKNNLLIEVCDVCGVPLLKKQQLGRKASNDALCHSACLTSSGRAKRITGKK